jgi:hypothetical protein
MSIIPGEHLVSIAVDMIWPCSGSDDRPLNQPRDCVIDTLYARIMSDVVPTLYNNLNAEELCAGNKQKHQQYNEN